MFKPVLTAAVLLSSAPALAQLSEAAPGDPAHPETVIEFGDPQPLTVETEEGDVSFSVWMADTDDERARGLMFREELADDAGMLFDFETVRPVSMWMRNTLIPLDLLFVSEEGRVTKIIVNARPQSLRQLPSDFPVRAVLELAGGRSAEAGIMPGDRIVHPMFVSDDPEEDAADTDGMTDDDAGEPAETDDTEAPDAE